MKKTTKVKKKKSNKQIVRHFMFTDGKTQHSKDISSSQLDL